MLAVLLLAAGGLAQQPIPAPFADEIAALGDQSSWAQDARYEGAQPELRARGVYPIGNGRVFAHCGLGARANTLQGITGPRYHADEEFAPQGHFGACTLELLAGGELLPLARQRVRRVRGAGFVVTEDGDPGGLALRTLTFAAPGTAALTRVVEVLNAGAQAQRAVELRLRIDAPAEASRATLRRRHAGTRAAFADFALSGASPRDGALIAQLGDLEPGARWRGVVTVETRDDADVETGAAPPTVDAAREQARATLRWWQEKLAATLEVDTDHARIRDLIRDWKVLMLTQRCAHSGTIVAMLHDRRADVRQSIGAMLVFLQLNLWDEARDLLVWIERATRRLGRVPDRTALDLDLQHLPATTDWEHVAVPDGDIPSWIVLLHHWYWRTTRDTELIRAHWPLLEVCIKRQKRDRDDLLGFHGSEPFLAGALHALLPSRAPERSLLIANAPAEGRRAHSFASGVLFLLALQAIGELLDATQGGAGPDTDAAAAAPGVRWLRRSIEFMRGLEERYWLADRGHFAPALSPLTGEPHAAPLAEANLLPLWIGWTFPSGERSRDNLRNSLAGLWCDGARIGSTATVGHATGHAQGLLLAALAERDAREREAALQALLAMAEPAGEWGALYDPEGRPTWTRAPDSPERLRPLDSGINFDALLYAMHGMRRATIPYWDGNDLRARLHLPPGARHLTIKNLRKDGRHLHLFLTSVARQLDAAERQENERLSEEARRDPAREHLRLRFRIELLSETPPAGRVDAAINAMNTMFVRHLRREEPIDETVFWFDGEASFFPAAPAGFAMVAPAASDAEVVVLANRNAATALLGGTGVRFVDTGLPWSAGDLAAMLATSAAGGARKLVLDWGYDEPGVRTCKPAGFWSSAVWQEALAAFRSAGGEVLTPGFAVRWEIASGPDDWRSLEAPSGRVELAAGGAAPTLLRTSFTAARDGEAVLRIGSGCGLRARFNGAAVLERQGPRAALPDADAALVRLRAGANTLEVELTGDGPQVLFARLTDSRGLPIADVR
jgi:hypothetical protein